MSDSGDGTQRINQSVILMKSNHLAAHRCAGLALDFDDRANRCGKIGNRSRCALRSHDAARQRCWHDRIELLRVCLKHRDHGQRVPSVLSKATFRVPRVACPPVLFRNDALLDKPAVAHNLNNES